MKTILSSRRFHYTPIVSIFLIMLTMVTLIPGMVGCTSRPPVNAIPIRTWYDLAAIGNNMTANYILENDLDASTDGWQDLASPTADDGKGWKPIVAVNESLPLWFTGVFDGQGHKIKDLFINRTGEEEVGLFAWTYWWGVITNVGLVNATVTGGERVGGLVSTISRGTVSNSYFTGTVTGDSYVGGLVGDILEAGNVGNCYATGSVAGNSTVGGLVGYIYEGTITGSYSTSNVTGNYDVGGLVGIIWESGTVSNSYSTGSVTGVEDIGGLVGFNWKGTVSNSYATGSVTGDDDVGGLVGQNPEGTVSNSYATGSVNGVENIGGLVGYNWAGTVSNSYATGSVSGNSYVGGLVGYDSGGTVTNCFWDTETSGLNVSAGGTGKNTTEMKDFTTFSGATWNITPVANPGTRDPLYIWNIVDDVTYPFLSWQPA